MTKSWKVSPHTKLSARSESMEEQSGVPKTTVIAIAAVATLLLVAIISTCVWLCLRKKKGKAKRRRYGKIDSIDESAENPRDPTGNIPLMRHEDRSQMSEYQGVPAPRYDDEDDIGLSMPQTPHRTPSDASLRSLPPSYSALGYAPAESVVRAVFQHPSESIPSVASTNRLKLLMLVNAQQIQIGNDRDAGEDRGGERGEPGHITSSEGVVLTPPRPIGRPRAGSRFREEDLDL